MAVYTRANGHLFRVSVEQRKEFMVVIKLVRCEESCAVNHNGVHVASLLSRLSEGTL
jgi:hypothetical protein